MKHLSINSFLWLMGFLFATAYGFLIIWHPQESWCDEAFWVDWGRQMGVNGLFSTHVWGGGRPSYSPGYAFFLAGVFRLFGFSFFTAKLPNIILSFWVFILLGASIIKETTRKGAILLLAFLFWGTSGMFYIINCGRPEVLSLLLALITVLAIVRNSWGSVFIASFLLMCTSVQGVIAASLFIILYSCFNKKEIIHKRYLFISHFGGYFVGVCSCAYIMYKHHCLKAFFDTMFGFSKTLTSLYIWLRAFVKVKVMGKVIEETVVSSNALVSPSQRESSFLSDVISAYIGSYEYAIAAILLLGLIIYYIWKHKPIHLVVKTTSLMAFTAPMVYTLMGRYVGYYRWVAWVPCIFAICMLSCGLKQKVMTFFTTIIIIIIFSNIFLCWKKEVIIDVHHLKDQENKKEIALAGLNCTEPTVIPYSWYYYVIETNENVYFQWSGWYPEELRRVIVDPSDGCNNPSFMTSCVFIHKIISMEEWSKVE